MKPVKLRNIIENLEMTDDSFRAFYSKNTSEIIAASVEDLAIVEDAEEGEDFNEYPKWQRESIKGAIDIVENWENYISLPDRSDIDEYRIMEEFCLSISNERIQDDMYYSIKGRGAFRRFKEKLHRYGLDDEWYSFKDNALRDIAISWCEDNGLEFIE